MEGDKEETIVLALIEEEDFQEIMSSLLVGVVQLQDIVKSFTYINKLMKSQLDVFKAPWNDSKKRN